MYVSSWRLLLLFSVALFGLGCTEVVPNVSSLSFFSNAPKIDGQTHKTVYVNLSNSSGTIDLVGTCDPVPGSYLEVRDADAADDDWSPVVDDPGVVVFDADCSDGSFLVIFLDPVQALHLTPNVDATVTKFLRVNDGTKATEALRLDFVYDVNAPYVVSFDLVTSSLTNTTPITWRLEFNEPILNGDLVVSDLLHTGGVVATSITNPANDNRTFFVNVLSMSADNSDLRFTLPVGVVRDLAGNYNGAAFQSYPVNYDITPPNLAFTVNTPDDMAMLAGSVIFEISCEVGLNVTLSGDVNPVQNFPCATSSLNATAYFTVGNGNKTIILTQADAAGNTTTIQRTYVSDTTAPTLTISPNGMNVADNPVTLTFTFSEPVTGFELNDIFVDQGTVSNLSGSGAVYTAQYIPAYYGAVYVGVNLGAVTDLVGNPNDTALVSFQSTAVMSLTVAPAYAAATNWNTYVPVSDSSANELSQQDLNCSGSETGYEKCLHGGEVRRVNVPGQNSCIGLTIEEELDVFDWACDTIFGQAAFYSRRLKEGKGLKDLLTMSGWRQNRVMVRRDGVVIGQSNLTEWWSNPVLPLPLNTGLSEALVFPNAIYVTDVSGTSGGFVIDANGIAVVTLGNASISFSGNLTGNCDINSGVASGNGVRAFFCFQNRRFIWIEGAFNGEYNSVIDSNAQVGVASYLSNFVRLHEVKFTNLGAGVYSVPHVWPAISLNNSRSNYLYNVVVNGCGGSALTLENSNYNTIRQFKGARCLKNGSTYMVNVINSSHNRFYDVRLTHDFNTISYESNGGVYLLNSSQNVFVRAIVSNLYSPSHDTTGFQLANSNQNIFSQVIVTNAESYAFYVLNSNENHISHSTLANNWRGGVFFDRGTVSPTNNVVNSTVLVNQGIGIEASNALNSGTNYLYGVVSAHNFEGYAIRNQSSYTGVFAISGFVGSNQECAISAGLSSDCNSTRVFIDQIGSSFIGALSGATTDAANQSDAASPVLYDTITDWLNFENLFRAWGPVMSGFAMLPLNGESMYSGPCISGMSCQISDWRLRSTSVLTERSQNLVNVNGFFTPGFACPSALSDAEVISSGGVTYLRHAMEIPFDKVGNDNGLCEANEECIYAPNIGAYQGEGDYQAVGTCVYSNPAVPNARIFKYPITSTL